MRSAATLKISAIVGFSLVMLSTLVMLTGLLRTHSNANAVEQIDLSENGWVNTNYSSVVSIDNAHNLRMPHRGVWLYIVNEHDQILMMKRPADAVTCPSTWNAPGEHTQFMETYADTAFRGLREELRLRGHQVAMLQPLLSAPSLLEIEYSALSTGAIQQKYDVQWTQSFLVRVLKSTVHKRNSNAEAVAMEWVSLDQLNQWASNNADMFCRVTRFLFSNADLGVRRNSTTFLDMLLLHADLIRSETRKQMPVISRKS